MSSHTQKTVEGLTFRVFAAAAAALVSLFLLVGVASARGHHHGVCRGATQPPRQTSLHELRSSMLCLVNRVRANYGLHPLSFNVELRSSAARHSRDMVVHDFFGHGGFRGGTFEGRIGNSGYLTRAAAFAVGENIGGGVGRQGSPVAVLRDWLHSPPHRENLLDPVFRDFGVGVSRGFPGGHRARGARAATYTLDLGTRHRR